MKRSHPFWLWCALAGCLVTLWPKGMLAGQPLSPQSSIATLRNEWNFAMTIKDTARLGNLVMEDAMFMSEKVRLEGRDALTSVFGSLFESRPDFRMRFSTVATEPAAPVVTDSSVSEYGTWTESFSTPGGVVVQDGTYYDVWRRTPAGWRIAVHGFTVTSCRGNPGYCRGER